jgi:plasmid maintenance system antidote protein VapI
MKLKLFERHPLPWELRSDSATCPNGSSISVIKDAEGTSVASSYNMDLDVVWAMYGVLTDAQKEDLGHRPFNPDWVSPPGHTIKTLQEERGFDNWTTADRLHLDYDDYDNLLKGDYPINGDLAYYLSAVFGGTGQFWEKREAQYRAALAAKEGEE